MPLSEKLKLEPAVGIDLLGKSWTGNLTAELRAVFGA